MKELTHVEANKILNEKKAALYAIQEAYRLGQQEAGVWVDKQRFRAACAALTGYNSNPNAVEADPEFKAQWSRLDADALIAELNRTASDAEKGGEHE